MQMKKILAVVMSLCMVAGTVSYGAPVITQSITAQAAASETSGFSFNKTTGRLTLSGTVDADALRKFNTTYRNSVKSVTAEKGTVLPAYCTELFYCYQNCTSIDLSNADTRGVTDMRDMFRGCSSLTKLDINGFNTSRVTTMRNMFWGCNLLTTLDISGFDTRRVTDMRYMFYGCSSLTKLDISGFDTSRVTDMSLMFCGCKSLTSLDVSRFNTSRVTTMTSMFSGCESLTSLDVSGFDTSNVYSMSSMFEGCIRLATLDLSAFDTSNVRYIGYMFYGCSELTSLDLSGFDTGKVTEMSDVSTTSNMFSSCNKLKSITLGENFKYVLKKAELPNSKGWVNVNAPTTIVSGDGKYAAIKNNGKNTYIIFTPTFPTNIKVEYSQDYNLDSHQVRFTWDKVEDADRYAIAAYLAGKWRVQKQDITETVCTSPKNLTPGKTYKVAIAARVNGKWDTANAIKNAVTVTIK